MKQAVPYLRCAGEDYPLAKECMHYEILALKQYYQFSPQHTLKIYHSDTENCLVVMQYSDNHIIMRNGMIATTYYPLFAEHISSFLACSK